MVNNVKHQLTIRSPSSNQGSKCEAGILELGGWAWQCQLCVILNSLLRPPVRIPRIPPFLTQRAVTFTNKHGRLAPGARVSGAELTSHTSWQPEPHQLLFLHPLISSLSERCVTQATPSVTVRNYWDVKTISCCRLDQPSIILHFSCKFLFRFEEIYHFKLTLLPL